MTLGTRSIWSRSCGRCVFMCSLNTYIGLTANCEVATSSVHCQIVQHRKKNIVLPLVTFPTISPFMSNASSQIRPPLLATYQLPCSDIQQIGNSPIAETFRRAAAEAWSRGWGAVMSVLRRRAEALVLRRQAAGVVGDGVNGPKKSSMLRSRFRRRPTNCCTWC